jgi:UDP-glucuronate 4-epimerase
MFEIAPSIFNMGHNAPMKHDLSIQPGDVPAIAANTDELDAWVGFKPNTPVTVGVARFVAWYRSFYKA